MSSNQNPFLAKIIPFIGMGITVVIIIFAIIIGIYLLIFGAIIGFILFAIAYIKQKFFSQSSNSSEVMKKGQTYDHDDFDRQ